MTDITVTLPAAVDLATIVSPQTVLTVTLPPGQYRPTVTQTLTDGTVTVQLLAGTSVVAEGRIGANGFEAFSDFVVSAATDITIVLRSNAGTRTGTFVDLTFLLIGAAGATPATTANTRTYRSWKDAVVAFTERADLEPALDTILAPVQTRLARDLNARAGEGQVTLSVIDGRVALPLDYKDVRVVLHEGHPLVYVGPEVFRGHPLIDVWQKHLTTGRLGIYTVEGSNLLVGPVPSPDDATTVTLIYYSFPGVLINDTDTHELLNEAFDLYLYAGVAELNNYAIEPGEAERYLDLYATNLRQYNLQQTRSRTATNRRANKPRPGMLI